ncbi:tumor protein D52 isoform X2 [Pteropus alecto]|uniref:tumor protein D52 isoform X2 n=1 Tax=Pteropus alecto TaxID=9402 RepID=UPI000D5353FD|nr:tumor protein D52 isoform X2 [Pteropus alecto]
MDSREMELYEDYQSPFDFDAGVNKKYLYLSPSGNPSPPGSPTTLQKFGKASRTPRTVGELELNDSKAQVTRGHGSQGHTYLTPDPLGTDPVPEAGEDVAAAISATETLSEEEQEELRRELAKVEEEIQTLSQVLAAKEKHLAEIKRKLGINSLQELKQNIARGWQDVTATPAYKKTSETLSQAGQKASAAFASVGSVITKKLEDVNIRSIQHSISMPAMRNSPTFKSFEEKVENLKSKVGGTKPAGGDFGEVLNSTANASATSTEPLPDQTQERP